MRCHATGSPRPIITWSHNGREVNIQNVNYNVTSLINDTEIDETMTIKKVNVSHYGNWTCKATNVVANGQQNLDEKVFLLIVTCEVNLLLVSFNVMTAFHVL